MSVVIHRQRASRRTAHQWVRTHCSREWLKCFYCLLPPLREPASAGRSCCPARRPHPAVAPVGTEAKSRSPRNPQFVGDRYMTIGFHRRRSIPAITYIPHPVGDGAEDRQQRIAPHIGCGKGRCRANQHATGSRLVCTCQRTVSAKLNVRVCVPSSQNG